jgi:hypothetical protein
MKKNSKYIIVKVDRFSAWLATILLICATVVYYLPHTASWLQIFNILFQLTFLIHTICSIYRFGFRKIKMNIKSLQIYSGYGILLTVILNIVFAANQQITVVVFWANWFFVGVHILLAIYCKRKIAANTGK